MNNIPLVDIGQVALILELSVYKSWSDAGHRDMRP